MRFLRDILGEEKQRSEIGGKKENCTDRRGET